MKKTAKKSTKKVEKKAVADKKLKSVFGKKK